MGAEQVDRRDEEGGRKGKEEWHWGLVKGSWRTLKKKKHGSSNKCDDLLPRKDRDVEQERGVLAVFHFKKIKWEDRESVYTKEFN